MILKKKALFVIMVSLVCNIQAVSFSEMSLMLQRVWHNPQEVGGIAPLSGYVCQEIVSQMDQNNSDSAKWYLEVGAGCGTTTEHIVKKLKPCDHLVLIEIDPEMADFLKKRYQGYDNVAVYCCSITDWLLDQKFDAIISTLPFNSFDQTFAKKTMKVFEDVAKPCCTLTYVECPIVGQLFKYFFSKKKRKQFEKVQKYLDTIKHDRLIRSKTIYANIPPIAVYHILCN